MFFRILLILIVISIKAGIALYLISRFRKTPQPIPETVCISKRSKVFHRPSCRNLPKENSAITKELALKKGLNACRICKA